ncbi:MAG TPA: pectinesterase family protein [Polyangiaceae bacterium]|nr:pectinesterase family protein [Polyangiaceae bacterium]
MTTRNPLSTCLLGAALLLASGCSSDPAAEDAAAGSAAVTGGNGNSVAGTAAAAAGHAGALTNGGLGGNLGMGGAGGSSAGSNQAGQSGAGATAGAAGGTGGASSAGGAAGAGGTAGAGGSAPSGPLPPSVTSLFPAPGASGVCVDAPLTINFASKPSIGAKGTIRIYAKASPSTVVDSIDVAATSFSDTIGGQARNLVRPVFIDDNSAVVYFHQHKLSPSTTYFVNISSGTFVDGQQAPLGTVTDQTLWTFTTGPAPAASASMTVDRLGSGQFCTVQGAFDAIAANDAAARTITVASGKYHELLYLGAKKNIKLRGADRAGTVLAYPNNDKLNAGTSARPLFYANGSTGLSIENLTIYNTTPQDGSQAEALRINADQVTVREVNLKSLQDTLQSTGKVYVVDSYIEGNVDFIWGNGPTYFDHCEIKTVGRAGAIVQARNGSGYGFVFVDSKLTADAGVTGQILARIDATAYPSSNVAYLNCQMTGIAAKGWTITPQGTSATGQLRFWEYQSTDASGTALSVSGRDAASKQLSATDAATLRDKATVLGGWNPP